LHASKNLVDSVASWVIRLECGEADGRWSGAVLTLSSKGGRELWAGLEGSASGHGGSVFSDLEFESMSKSV